MESKKVGILTFHNADNYGAFLQCYALQEVLKRLGHYVEIINYKQPYIEHLYEPIKKEELLKVLKKPRWYFGYFFKQVPAKFKTHIKYRFFRKQYLKTGKAFKNNQYIPGKYDSIIIGSDQVWGLHCTNGVDKIYFGEFPHKDCKVIGYGISGNINSLEEIGDEQLKKYCNNFNKLSFREKNFQEYIKEHIGIEGELVLDPTLLLNKAEWEKLCNKAKPKYDYVLSYILQEGENFSTLNDKLSLFAKKVNCKLVNIFDVAHSPAEFLTWIKNAKYIIATSFHATVFSIIFEKEFFALKTNNGHDGRYINLVNALSIPDRAIELEELTEIERPAIDYHIIQKKLIELKKESIKYLNEI